MKQVINGIVTTNVDVVFRTGNNFHAKITARDAEGDIMDLALYPNISWVFFERYDKTRVKLQLKVGTGIVIVDKSAIVFISPADLPQGESKHEFKLSSTMDVMAGKAMSGDYYQDSFISYSPNAVAEGLTIDIYGDIIESQFIDLDADVMGNLTLDNIYKVSDAQYLNYDQLGTLTSTNIYKVTEV